MNGEECDKDTNQCIFLSCRNTTGKLGGSIKMKDSYDSSKWFIGDIAEFCCEDGIDIFDTRILKHSNTLKIW